MPQVDLETLVTAFAGGNDRKIACETLADANENDVVSGDHEPPPDLPPESFWLSKDAEYDWFDRNAFYERKESTKGNSSSGNPNPNPHLNPSASSTSQRFSVGVKPKAFIIGLPNAQKIDSKRRTSKPANMRLFPPKRSESVGKSTAGMAEPGSPKVSCMGRVRSKRCRRRSNSLKRREKPVEKARAGGEKQKTGFYSKVMSMFRSKKSSKIKKSASSRSGSRKVVEEREPEPERRSVSRNFKMPVGGEPGSEPPSLGGMKRFASGRRSGSWTAEDFNSVVGPMGRS